jgi:LysR family transcriptional regulator for metE and metH
LLSDEVVFVVGAAHPLARASALTRDDLQAHPLICGHSPAGEVRWFARSVFGRANPRLEFLRFPLTEAIMDAARAGMGVAVVSEWVAGSYLGGGDLLVKRLESGPLRRPWRVAYRRAFAEPALALAGVLATAAPRLPAGTASRSPRRRHLSA